MEKNMTTIVKNQRKQFRPLDPTKVPVDSSVTWNYKNQYLLETDSGNFIWNDPFAGGDGILRPFHGTYKDWLHYNNIPYGRYKGEHFVDAFCAGATFNSAPYVF